MPKNHTLKALRITEEMDELLNEASSKLDFKKADLVRFLLNRALKQLKAASIEARGFENLEFSLKENKS